MVFKLLRFGLVAQINNFFNLFLTISVKGLQTERSITAIVSQVKNKACDLYNELRLFNTNKMLSFYGRCAVCKPFPLIFLYLYNKPFRFYKLSLMVQFLLFLSLTIISWSESHASQRKTFDIDYIAVAERLGDLREFVLDLIDEIISSDDQAAPRYPHYLYEVLETLHSSLPIIAIIQNPDDRAFLRQIIHLLEGIVFSENTECQSQISFDPNFLALLNTALGNMCKADRGECPERFELAKEKWNACISEH